MEPPLVINPNDPDIASQIDDLFDAQEEQEQQGVIYGSSEAASRQESASEDRLERGREAMQAERDKREQANPRRDFRGDVEGGDEQQDQPPEPPAETGSMSDFERAIIGKFDEVLESLREFGGIA